MDHELLIELRNKSLRRFVQIFFAHILFLVLLQFVALGHKTFAKHVVVVFYLSAATLLTFFVFTFLFHRLNNGCYRFFINESVSPEAKAERLKKFHTQAPVLLACATFAGLFMTLGACYFLGLLVTLYQLFMFYTMGHFVALMGVMILYYIEKTEYFPLVQNIPFKPLSMSGKLVIPIGYIASIIIAVICSVSYKISYMSMEAEYRDTIVGYIDAQNDILENVFGQIKSELIGYAASDEIQSQDPAKMIRFLRQVHETRNSNMETIIAITANGHGYTSLGRENDFSAQQFYLEPIKTGKSYTSTLHTSMITGKSVTTVVIPVRRDGKTIGLLGATITANSLSRVFEDLNTLTDRAQV